MNEDAARVSEIHRDIEKRYAGDSIEVVVTALITQYVLILKHLEISKEDYMKAVEHVWDSHDILHSKHKPHDS